MFSAKSTFCGDRRCESVACAEPFVGDVFEACGSFVCRVLAGGLGVEFRHVFPLVVG